MIRARDRPVSGERRKMQGLNVFEKGIGYLEACLTYYNGSNAYAMLYVIALLYILVFGNSREKQIFLPSGIFLILTVYNPLAPVVLDRFFDVNSEYYRLFWITPIVILLPYAAVKLLWQLEGSLRRAAAVLLTLIFLLSGSFLYKNGIRWADNIYKMPEDMLEVSRVIHEDSSSKYPKVFLEYEYNMQMRQYDPGMLLTVDREDYLYAVVNEFTQEQLEDETHPQYKIIAALVKYQDVSVEDFLDAMEETHTEYVVLDKASPMFSYLEEAGLKQAGTTQTHRIMKYELREPYEFELVDYSVVY